MNTELKTAIVSKAKSNAELLEALTSDGEFKLYNGTSEGNYPYCCFYLFNDESSRDTQNDFSSVTLQFSIYDENPAPETIDLIEKLLRQTFDKTEFEVEGCFPADIWHLFSRESETEYGDIRHTVMHFRIELQKL